MKLQVGVILFGVGEGITTIELQEGCCICKASIFDKEILCFYDDNPLNMQKKYADAINTDGTFYWINAEFVLNCDEYKKNETELKYLTIIDKQIRMLRLVLGRYIFAKDFRYIVNLQEEYRICGSFPSPDLATESIDTSNIDIQNAINTQNLLKLDIPFKNGWIYNVFLVYEKSFSKDIEVSFVTTVTALEMLFLDNNQAIKEKISKRIAVYLSDEYEERRKIYKYIGELYKKRCEFVHEGKNNSITMGEITYMRDIIRRVIIQFMDSEKTKKEFCVELVERINCTDYWNKKI